MKVKGEGFSYYTPTPTKLLDKTIWNPRPVIGLVSRAVIGSADSFPFFTPPKEKILAPHPDPTSPEGPP